MKGCLLTALLALVLVVALGLGGYFAGKRYIEANLPAWEAEYPILGALSALLSLDRDDAAGWPRRVEGRGEGHIPVNAFYWSFVNKWLSADGLAFRLVFTGPQQNDSWNTLRGRFVRRLTSAATGPRSMTR